VLLKSDGYPTYQLAVVIDDHLMKVTHVMRGIEWLPSTPKHVLLYEAFGWELPVHVHLPDLKELGENQKLSKRRGSVSAIGFLEEGYLPEALVNFLMFLGWNPGTDREIYSLEEFIKDFSIEKIHRSDLVVFDRDKLLWFNGYYIRNTETSELWKKLAAWAAKFNIKLNGADRDEEYNMKVLDLVKDRMKKLSEFNDLTNYFYEFSTVDRSLLVEFAENADKAKEIVTSFKDLYGKVSETAWTKDNLDKLSHDFIKERNYSAKEAFMTLRSVFTGEKATPPLFDILALLGRKESLKRLDSALIQL
jgi:nondiscriminating glutamyl-tRNA synthetase